MFNELQAAECSTMVCVFVSSSPTHVYYYLLTLTN